jgi:hypothetical protein
VNEIALALAHPITLTTIVRNTPWLCEVLEVVRAVGPLGGYVAAGAVRDTVWDALTGRPSTRPSGDVDVVYWAEAEPEGAPLAYETKLRAALPAIVWEVTNQATIHLWHRQMQGLAAEPHRSVADGLATWPETATAVGVRLGAEGTLDILAPLGLADLFALRLRHNPVLTSPDVFRQRAKAKRWLQRWPELQLIEPAGE